MRLIAAFLTDRTMQVRVGSARSLPRQVSGGCPQGSILGVLPFNITTDNLEEDSPYMSAVSRPEVAWAEEDDDSFFAAEQ